MNKRIIEQFELLKGQEFIYSRVGEYNSLSLGFGEKIFKSNPKTKYNFYCEWEIGSFRGVWRIIKGNKIILGSKNLEGFETLNKKINKIDFGKLISIEQSATLNIKIRFEKGLIIDFIAAFSDKDEFFHAFCPNHIYIVIDNNGKWKITKSNEPFIT